MAESTSTQYIELKRSVDLLELGMFVTRLNSQSIVQAGKFVGGVVYYGAEPEPGLHVSLIKFDHPHKRLAGLLDLTGFGGANPLT